MDNIFSGISDLNATDLGVYAGVFILFGLIIWVSNKEIRKSRAYLSHKISETEHIVKDQTRISSQSIFMIAEKKKIAELEKTAQFGELSRGLFHDLMNPLSSISLRLEHTLSARRSPEEAYHEIQKIIGMSRRMESYMNSLKRCMTSPDAAPSEHVADVAREIALVCDVLAYKARMANTELKVVMSEPISLHVHPVRLHQVLLNLVTNAIDACAEKNKSESAVQHITIEAGKNNENATIMIRDTGCGMSDQSLNQAFKKSFTTKQNGTGMGLITVQTIIEKELKGTVSFENNGNAGTTFNIRIPIS
jgi:signal transduction histidine kinase